MSSHATESTTDEDEDEMELDPEPNRGHPTIGPSNLGENSGTLATILRDSTSWLPNVKALRETDVIILLTPVVVPISQDPTDTSDPFEPLGRSLAKRHARIRQVPYTQRNGITSTHLGFIKRGHVIILCFVLQPGQQVQLDFADVAFAVSDNKPCIIVVCCSPIDSQLSIPFPTVIQTAGYTPAALEATAALIFSEQSTSVGGVTYGPARTETPRPRLWPVEQWNEARDMQTVLDLWTQNISGRFSIDHHTLASLLRRPGYAKHYVVRDSRTEEILGFCATYLSYVDQEGEKLIASLAILLVRPRSRQQGIGLSLHNHAIGQLKKTRGVIRLQLGSTFPRILYGPPIGIHLNEEWFRRRGWMLNREVPGQGQAICDLVLNFTDWRYIEPHTSTTPQFRLCSQEDMVKVLAMVEQASVRQAKMGWFDQYSCLMNGPNVKDIVLGVEKEIIVAAALTYTPSCGSPIASNLPWAGRIGNDVGGVTCICISRTLFIFITMSSLMASLFDLLTAKFDDPPINSIGCGASFNFKNVGLMELFDLWTIVPKKLLFSSAPRQDPVIVGLLDACVKNLKDQGMRRMFLDGVAEELDDFKRLGFVEWARYKDVWKDT